MEWEGRQEVCTCGKSMCCWRGEYIYECVCVCTKDSKTLPSIVGSQKILPKAERSIEQKHFFFLRDTEY